MFPSFILSFGLKKYIVYFSKASTSHPPHLYFPPVLTPADRYYSIQIRSSEDSSPIQSLLTQFLSTLTSMFSVSIPRACNYFQSQDPNTRCQRIVSYLIDSHIRLPFHRIPIAINYACIHNLTPWQYNIQVLLLWCSYLCIW